MLRAQCGDREALELVLRSVQPALRRYLAGVAGRDEAEDVLQDVLLTVCRKIAWLDAPELFRAWAFRIASRASFKHLEQREAPAGAAARRRSGREPGGAADASLRRDAARSARGTGVVAGQPRGARPPLSGGDAAGARRGGARHPPGDRQVAPRLRLEHAARDRRREAECSLSPESRALSRECRVVSAYGRPTRDSGLTAHNLQLG